MEQAYADAGQPQHKVSEFIDDMAAAYAGPMWWSAAPAR